MKFGASILKEIQLLIHDKIGLLILYIMPILLVFIITIVQDSTFRLVNENQMDLLVINNDEGHIGDELIDVLEKSGSFTIEVNDSIAFKDLKNATLDHNKLISLYIPSDFTKNINGNASHVSNVMLTEFGIGEGKNDGKLEQPTITFYYDPVLQENFRMTLTTNLQTILVGLENKAMVEQLFRDMDYDSIPAHIEKEMNGRQTQIISQVAGKNGRDIIPNSTQHNIPAWTIFAMFFMVITLGGNLVKERLSGSFLRLQTIPSAFMLTIWSKMLVFVFVAMTQMVTLFCIGMFVFPLIGLPELVLPDAMIQLFLVSFLSALAAVSYAILIGTYAKSQEQANGFGAVSIIIFAAIGGIWVPTFIMPDYLQQIGKLSPLYWCLDGFYTLFLKNGSWSELSGTLIYLIMFTFVCQLLTFIKLRLQNYL